jgi:hypothetical protein
MDEQRQKMDIVDWLDSPRPIVSRTRPPRQLWSPTVIGVLGTLLLHALIVPSALLGSRARRTHPPEIQEPGAFIKSNADTAESLVLVTLPTISDSNQESTPDISSLPALSKLKPVAQINPDPPAFLNVEVLTLGEEQASQSTVNSADGSEQARLFGIYTGQIQARIERIWRRPRTPVNETTGPEVPAISDEAFQCRTQIVQDASGIVQEVLLLRCNGSLVWQRSLVIAIQQASPLPAPPSVNVFSHSISLDFLGLSYVPGSPDDDYEIASAKVVQTNGAVSRSAVSLAAPPPSNGLLGGTNTIGPRK